MKTLAELYQEILADNNLKETFAKAMEENALESFLKECGCAADKEEVLAFLQAQTETDKEISDDELENVSGGCNNSDFKVNTGNGMKCV